MEQSTDPGETFTLYEHGEAVGGFVSPEEAISMSSVVDWRPVTGGWDGYAPVRPAGELLTGGPVVEVRLERCAFIRSAKP